jgi:hypothetical protein
MTATTRSVECSAPGAPLMLAFELGSTKWVLGFTTAPAQRPRLRTIAAGDLPGLTKEILLAKARFGLSLDVPVRSCYEAGRDGFWLHRWLITQDVENVVVDSSSIEVNRRARRAKTDRLDVGKLLALLLRWLGGERKVWSVVRVPSPEAEAQRQLTREIATVREDRKRVRNRIQSLLATQGILTGPVGTTGMIERPEVKGETRHDVSGAGATRDCESTSVGPVATRTPTRWSTTRWPCSEASMSRGPS